MPVSDVHRLTPSLDGSTNGHASATRSARNRFFPLEKATVCQQTIHYPAEAANAVPKPRRGRATLVEKEPDEPSREESNCCARVVFVAPSCRTMLQGRTSAPMTVSLHFNDIPRGLEFGAAVAIDTETLGLKPGRDRLCLVQLSSGDGTAHLVQFEKGRYEAPNLRALLANPNALKIFHFGRFDIAVLLHYLGVSARPVYCTKIASKLVRTFTDRHGLRDLCRELLGVEISKQQQTSDWGQATLTPEQLNYAASDVLHLHALKLKLDALLAREDRTELAQACFAFLPFRAELDLKGWYEEADVFNH
jgi:ribonuclease D